MCNGTVRRNFFLSFCHANQVFKSDEKMNGLFEAEAPFKCAELISSDNFGTESQ